MQLTVRYALEVEPSSRVTSEEVPYAYAKTQTAAAYVRGAAKKWILLF
jgi:hypothetical protein